MDSLVFASKRIVYFLIYFSLITIILSILLKLIIKNKDTKLKKLLLGFLNNNTKLNNISCSLLYIFVIYTTYFIIFNTDYTSPLYNWNFYYLLIPLLIYDIINLKILRIGIDIGELLVIYYLNYIKNGIYLYTKLINNTWYIKVMCHTFNIFLIVLTVLIALIHLKYLINSKGEKK